MLETDGTHTDVFAKGIAVGGGRFTIRVQMSTPKKNNQIYTYTRIHTHAMNVVLGEVTETTQDGDVTVYEVMERERKSQNDCDVSLRMIKN